MKKTLIFLAALLLILAGSLYAQEFTLNEAIGSSVRVIEETLPRGSKVAVINFTSPSEDFSAHVIDELIGELLANGHFTVVDRNELSLLDQEFELFLSGLISDESAQSIGQLLGAEFIVSGSIMDMGSFYRFRIRIIRVLTAEILLQLPFDLVNDSEVNFFLNPAGTLSGTQIITETTSIEAPQTIRLAPFSYSGNNWLSINLFGGLASISPAGEVIIAAIGASYERMLTQSISLGARSFIGYNIILDGSTFGIDLSIAFYPGQNRLFYMGAGFGFLSVNRGAVTTSTGSLNGNFLMTGFSLSPEIGLKIDIGNPGGFYLQPGLRVPVYLHQKNWAKGLSIGVGVLVNFSLLYNF